MDSLKNKLFLYFDKKKVFYSPHGLNSMFTQDLNIAKNWNSPEEVRELLERINNNNSISRAFGVAKVVSYYEALILMIINT